MSETGRKAELRRLSAKQGWYDAFDGSGPYPPRKGVMHPSGRAVKHQVTADEEQAYWDGYDEGLVAESGDDNPYAAHRCERKA